LGIARDAPAIGRGATHLCQTGMPQHVVGTVPRRGVRSAPRDASQSTMISLRAGRPLPRGARPAWRCAHEREMTCTPFSRALPEAPRPSPQLATVFARGLVLGRDLRERARRGNLDGTPRRTPRTGAPRPSRSAVAVISAATRASVTWSETIVRYSISIAGPAHLRGPRQQGLRERQALALAVDDPLDIMPRGAMRARPSARPGRATRTTMNAANVPSPPKHRDERHVELADAAEE